MKPNREKLKDIEVNDPEVVGQETDLDAVSNLSSDYPQVQEIDLVTQKIKKSNSPEGFNGFRNEEEARAFEDAFKKHYSEETKTCNQMDADKHYLAEKVEVDLELWSEAMKGQRLEIVPKHNIDQRIEELEKKVLYLKEEIVNSFPFLKDRFDKELFRDLPEEEEIPKEYINPDHHTHTNNDFNKQENKDLTELELIRKELFLYTDQNWYGVISVEVKHDMLILGESLRSLSPGEQVERMEDHAEEILEKWSELKLVYKHCDYKQITLKFILKGTEENQLEEVATKEPKKQKLKNKVLKLKEKAIQLAYLRVKDFIEKDGWTNIKLVFEDDTINLEEFLMTDDKEETEFVARENAKSILSKFPELEVTRQEGYKNYAITEFKLVGWNTN